MCKCCVKSKKYQISLGFSQQDKYLSRYLSSTTASLTHYDMLDVDKWIRKNECKYWTYASLPVYFHGWKLACKDFDLYICDVLEECNMNISKTIQKLEKLYNCTVLRDKIERIAYRMISNS